MAQELKVIADFYDFMLWLIRHTEIANKTIARTVWVYRRRKPGRRKLTTEIETGNRDKPAFARQ